MPPVCTKLLLNALEALYFGLILKNAKLKPLKSLKVAARNTKIQWSQAQLTG